MRNDATVWIVLILALIYILSPVDVIPDPIPVAGWVDDVAVGVGAGAAALSGDKR